MKGLQYALLLLLIATSMVAYGQQIASYPDSINRKRLNQTIITEAGTYLGGMAFLNYIWYKDDERVPFHFYNDGGGYLQMDKFGHAFAAYRESYAAYHALRKAGVGKKKALLYGGPIGFVFQAPIEVFDGIYEGWGFSWYDIAANAFGSALFMIQEAAFDDQVFLMKFSYSPSGYPKYHSTLGETPLESFFLDYNAHTYWLSGNLLKLTGIKTMPPWLNIALCACGCKVHLAKTLDLNRNHNQHLSVSLCTRGSITNSAKRAPFFSNDN